jgi:hypothetical protein
LDAIRVSLDSIQTVAGLLIAFAVSVAGLWVVVARPQWVDPHQFKQARRLATLVVAVGLVLVFVLWGNARSLPQLSRVALVGIPICLAAFLVNVAIQVGRNSANLLPVLAYLVSLITYTAAGSISLSASAVMLMVWGNVQRPVEQDQNEADPVQVSVQISGVKTVQSSGEPIPFQVTSGQLNWGCDQTVNAEARFKLPAGATVTAGPTAAWQGVVNGRDSTTSIERSPEEIVARGRLVGQPSIPFEVPLAGRVLHCPGGGNGELRLAGSYTLTERNDAPFETVLSGKLTDTALSLELPSADDLRLVEATVDFSSSNASTPDGGRLIVPLAPDDPADKSNERFRVRRVGTRLEISRR